MSEYAGGLGGMQTGPNAAEQLAELQLLTRADHHGGQERDDCPLALDIRMDEDSMTVTEQDESDEIAIESSGNPSFSALLAASRRLAGSGSSASSPLSSPAVNTVDSPRHAQEVRARRPTTMPSLSEEDAEESSTEDGSESPAVSSESGSHVVVETERFAHHSRRGSGKACAVSVDSDESNCRDEGEINENFAFEDMVHRLPYDLSFLSLSVSDLTPRNLLRIRDALARNDAATGPAQRDDSRDARPPLDKMRLVRTMMAVDTLRLFLLRYDEDEVLGAVTEAVRKIYAQYVDDHGVRPLSHMQGVLTSSNIARVVLLVRDMLQNQEQKHVSMYNHGDNNRFEQSAKSPRRLRSGGRSSPTKSTSSTSLSSWRSRRSASSSPSKALSPGASWSSSPGRTSSDNSSPRRACSIFASEGIHVLMNEKITAFQHRGDANRLASFKVRRDSDVHAEEAAKRRQRSIQYASETTRALRG